MPDGRTWVVSENDRSWEVRTAGEGEVYFRPIDSKGVATGGWKPGLPPLHDRAALPDSLREVLEIFATSAERDQEPC
jgi:hypothetical protein